MNAAVLSISSLGDVSTIPIDKRFGVRLAVTPYFLSNDRVQLQIEAERTVLNPKTHTPGFAYNLQIAETKTNANVVMNFGDTLILSGLSEKRTLQARDGVLILQDIPLMQYFFSTKSEGNFHRSVLILITPRLPEYVSKAAHGATESPEVKALKATLGLSSTIPSNALSMLKGLNKTPLFREFQQSDVVIERWDRMRSTASRLNRPWDFSITKL